MCTLHEKSTNKSSCYTYLEASEKVKCENEIRDAAIAIYNTSQFKDEDKENFE